MKMMTKIHILLTFLICGCAPALAQPRAVSVNPSERFQTIDNFTASDAWSGEFVGRYWIRPECYTASFPNLTRIFSAHPHDSDGETAFGYDDSC